MPRFVTSQSERDLIRYAARRNTKAFVTFLRHVGADHYRVMKTATGIVREAARKLHAAVERLIDLIEEGYLQAIFSNQTLFTIAHRVATLVLKRSRCVA